MKEQITLREKYSIPIEHLDYEYIKHCQNTKEIERIILVLRSGEDGFYPDLIKFAEDKLQELDPENIILRTEIKCQPTSVDVQKEINVSLRIFSDKN